MKTSKLMYTLIFWLYVINGNVPLLLLFGFDWLTNMSMYMIYFGLNVQINIIYILVKFLLIATTILLIKYVNKKIKIETKSEDDKLEDNPTIPKYYDKFLTARYQGGQILRKRADGNRQIQCTQYRICSGAEGLIQIYGYAQLRCKNV